VAVRLPEGAGDLAEIVRALDAEGLRVADLRLHSPSLDDVFLAKTGRSLEGAAEEVEESSGGHEVSRGDEGRPSAETISA
ncbi:MAG TPA: hypothetical protein VJ722_03600, partial [Rhodanobacteraceae bacterium]|nr:hypothetical protein [Rhodanobacteraceae bacterium]